MWLFLLTLWITISSAIKNSQEVNVVKSTSLLGQIVSEYSIKQHYGVETSLECLVHCAVESFCQTAFYRSADEYCQTNAVPYRFDSKWQAAEGTEFWESTYHKCNINEGYTYSRVGKFCYKFHPKESLAWPDARQICVQEGGDLVSLDTMEKYHYIVKTIRVSPELFNTSAFYVGANDKDVEGSWFWVNGVPMTFASQMWHPGEPSGAKDNEDYARIDNERDQLLSDSAGSSGQSFICEIELNE